MGRVLAPLLHSVFLSSPLLFPSKFHFIKESLHLEILENHPAQELYYGSMSQFIHNGKATQFLPGTGRSLKFCDLCCGHKESACQCRRCKRCGFDPWVGKIPWRRTWQPTPVVLPGESHGQRILAGTVHGVIKSWTRLSTHARAHTRHGASPTRPRGTSWICLNE